MNASRSSFDIRTIYRFALFVVMGWTLLVAGSLAWYTVDQRRETLLRARTGALITFNKDQAFRFWVTKHGGVYVPETADTPPNPFLRHVPDREIILPSGKRLTLMNPAYALRQLMTDYEQDYGVRGHITSLRPINPANAPDAWERSALRAFAQGAGEVMEATVMDGQRVLRLMRPMIVTRGCLKCHAAQGYKEGDVRGGVSVTLPLASYLANERTVRHDMLLTHGLIWLTGLGGIGFISFKTRKDLLLRLRQEESLRRSEERFRCLVEASADVVWETDAEGVYTYVSPRVVETLGSTPGELTGTTLFASLPAGERDRFSQLFADAVRAGRPLTLVENTRIRADGRAVVLESSALPVFDRAGRVTGFRGIDRDVTERERAARENQRLREFFESIAENIMTGVWVANRDDVIFYANRGMGAIAGVPTHRLVNLRVLADLPDATLQAFGPLYEQAKRSLQPLSYRALHVETLAGEACRQSGWIIPRISDGVYDGMLCTVEDVTEAKKAEEALSESTRMLRTLFQATPLAIVLLDADRNVRMWNPAAERIFGWSEEEVLGGPIPIVPEDRTDAFNGGAEEVMPGVVLVNRETQRRKKDGTLVDVEISTALLYGADGKVSGRMAIIADITQRKRAEDEMRHTNELLEQVFSLGGILIATFDRNFTFVRVNRSYAEANGRPPEFFPGRNCFALSPNAENEAIFRSVVETGEPYAAYERPFPSAGHLEGGTTYWDWTLHPVKDAHGVVQSLVLILRDVTERRRGAGEQTKCEKQS